MQKNHEATQGKNTIEMVNRAYEEYKNLDDLPVADKAVQTDILLEEKRERLDDLIGSLQSKLARDEVEKQRPSLAREDFERKSLENQHYERFMRNGTVTEEAMEHKALSTQTGGDGYIAPPQVEASILEAIGDSSPMRRICSIQKISAASYQKPVSLGGMEVGWANETSVRNETKEAELSVIDFPTTELYAMPAATQTLLDDAAVDMESWLAAEVQSEFGRKETEAFVKGDGNGKPKGFLSYIAEAAATRSKEALGYVATGVADSLGDNPMDSLLDLIYALNEGYRAQSRFVMNRNSLSMLRKLRDADGKFIWQPSATAGVSSLLLGYPVTEVEDMPSMQADAFPIAYGNFARGYLIVDRTGLTILRDPFTKKPHILFYVTKRLGGGVQDYNAIKLLKVAAS